MNEGTSDWVVFANRKRNGRTSKKSPVFAKREKNGKRDDKMVQPACFNRHIVTRNNHFIYYSRVCAIYSDRCNLFRVYCEVLMLVFITLKIRIFIQKSRHGSGARPQRRGRVDFLPNRGVRFEVRIQHLRTIQTRDVREIIESKQQRRLEKTKQGLANQQGE
jgi:hypothetical protein